MNINPLFSICAVPAFERREREVPLGASEELLGIATRLKEALENLSTWVHLHPILYRLDEKSLQTAAEELIANSEIFQQAHAELMSYCGQIPEPADITYAIAMQKTIEECFLTDIDRLTPFQVDNQRYTSWGAFILGLKPIEWTPALLKSLFLQIKNSAWNQVRIILKSTIEQL